jgi:hypothetical protein
MWFLMSWHILRQQGMPRFPFGYIKCLSSNCRDIYISASKGVHLAARPLWLVEESCWSMPSSIFFSWLCFIGVTGLLLKLDLMLMHLVCMIGLSTEIIAVFVQTGILNSWYTSNNVACNPLEYITCVRIVEQVACAWGKVLPSSVC